MPQSLPVPYGGYHGVLVNVAVVAVAPVTESSRGNRPVRPEAVEADP